MNIVVEEGEIVTVIMRVRVPRAATEDQLDEWLRFEIGGGSSLDMGNPLSKHEPQEWGNNNFEWTRDGVRGFREEFDHEDLGENHKRYRVRYREVRV